MELMGIDPEQLERRELSLALPSGRPTATCCGASAARGSVSTAFWAAPYIGASAAFLLTGSRISGK